jgi:hypothetical protein
MNMTLRNDGFNKLGRAPSHRDEDGSILVIVLVIVTVIGLVLGAVLAQAAASMKNTTVVNGHENKVYAADDGLEYAIQKVRLDTTICPNAGDTGNSTNTPAFANVPKLNGRQIALTCQTVTGSVGGINGYAVVTLDNTDQGLTTQSGGHPLIEGPVYAKTLPASVDLTIKKSNILEEKAGGRCNTSADIPNLLKFDPSHGFGYTCLATPNPPIIAQVAVAGPLVLPQSVPSAPASPPKTVSVGGNTWKVFYPGTYTSTDATPFSLSSTYNYFASGVYYFKNIPFVVGNQTVVVGGAAYPGDANTQPEKVINTPPSLQIPTDAQTLAAAGLTATAANVSGSGVKFILGGSSMMGAGNPAGVIELFARRAPGWNTVPLSSTAANEGVQRISVMTVPTVSAPNPWAAAGLKSTLIASNPVLQVGNGTNPSLTLHGTAWVPNAFVDFYATNNSEAQLRGGVVAARLKLQNSASASGLTVSVFAETAQRHMILTSTALGSTDGGRDVKATAVIDVVNDSSRSVVVNSWNNIAL